MLKLFKNIRNNKGQIFQCWAIRIFWAYRLIWTINTQCLLRYSLFCLITEASNKNSKENSPPTPSNSCQLTFANVMFMILKIPSQFAMTNQSKELYFAVLPVQKNVFCKNFGYTVRCLVSLHSYSKSEHIKNTQDIYLPFVP